MAGCASLSRPTGYGLRASLITDSAKTADMILISQRAFMGGQYDGRSKRKDVLTSVEMLKDYQGEKVKIGSS